MSLKKQIASGKGDARHEEPRHSERNVTAGHLSGKSFLSAACQKHMPLRYDRTR